MGGNQVKQRILIIDDEPGIRDALRQVLEYEGYEVRAASSGGEGLTVYPEFRPDATTLSPNGAPGRRIAFPARSCGS